MDFNLPLYLDGSSAFHGDPQLGMSLEEMIDTDMKTDFDDISCANTSGNFASVDCLDLVRSFIFLTSFLQKSPTLHK
jgi:hypothetical protein